MSDALDLAALAALLGEPTRSRMLTQLMGGEARTASELAADGEVSASTASIHLGRLAAAGLVSRVKQGRHCYFRLANADVAAAIEALLRLTPGNPPPTPRPGPRDERLRRARICYDHLAGEAGVRLLAGLRGRGLLAGEEEALQVTTGGESWCRRLGLDLEALHQRRRGLCRACLDWSERRHHLAGALGAALLTYLFDQRMARREHDCRAIVLSPRGLAFVDTLEPPS